MNYLQDAGLLIEVSGVKRAEQKLPTLPFRQALSKTVSKNLEACSVDADELIKMMDPCNGLIQSLNFAYDRHYPISLSPDVIWTTIAQGLARYINLNSEKVRHLFVEHEGKKTLAVYRDEFIIGSPDNDWAGVFPEFSEQIAKHIPTEMHQLILNDFSTTGPLEKVVSEITLMDAMQSYFSYECYTCCGIPAVILTGTHEDWCKVLGKVYAIGEYFPELAIWSARLGNILKQFTAAFRGSVDKNFWDSIYKVNGGSGGPYINGWIVNFFPYLRSHGGHNYNRKNRIIFDPAYKEGGFMDGINPDAFPPSFSTVPFTWLYYGREFAYQFLGGIFGAVQNDDDLTIVPRMGWGVQPC